MARELDQIRPRVRSTDRSDRLCRVAIMPFWWKSPNVRVLRAYDSLFCLARPGSASMAAFQPAGPGASGLRIRFCDSSVMLWVCLPGNDRPRYRSPRAYRDRLARLPGTPRSAPWPGHFCRVGLQSVHVTACFLARLAHQVQEAPAPNTVQASLVHLAFEYVGSLVGVEPENRF